MTPAALKRHFRGNSCMFSEMALIITPQVKSAIGHFAGHFRQWHFIDTLDLHMSFSSLLCAVTVSSPAAKRKRIPIATKAFPPLLHFQTGQKVTKPSLFRLLIGAFHSISRQNIGMRIPKSTPKRTFLPFLKCFTLNT